MKDDLIRAGSSPAFVVVGFFTPDYRDQAKGLASSIDRHTDPVQVAYHLYAVPKPAGSAWNDIILMKPQIVLRAMQDYPGVTIVLMDVDCRVNSEISGLGDAVKTGDIGIRYVAKMHSSESDLDWFTSRVLVVRPTEGAKLLVTNWLRICQSDTRRNDEVMLSVAIRITPSATLEVIPFDFSGVEETKLAGRKAAITHISAHSQSKTGHPLRTFVKKWRRQMFASLTGRPYHEIKIGRVV
jgi:hypothetical protein